MFLVFGRAIHSLSKIGDEIYIEPQEHGVTIYIFFYLHLTIISTIL
jgi:hypothetical protein